MALGVAVAFICLSSRAQPFLVPNNGDLLAGFRKTGANQANYECVTRIGNILDFEALAPGVQTTINSYTPSELADGFSDFNNLQWSVFGGFKFGSWQGFPNATAWLTIPRSDVNVQAPNAGRFITSSQNSIRGWILSVGTGSAFISSGLVSNVDNTATFVREPAGDTVHGLSAYIGDPSSPQIGDFNGVLPYTIENTTPPAFTSAVRSDLYQLCPSDMVDPITHSTGTTAYHVGYFQLNPDGTMIFTRATTNTVAVPPPPPTVKSATRIGNVTTISFTTTNGATYALYYANPSGLDAPTSSWSVLPSTVTGDGTVKSLKDTTTDSARFYRVGAH